MLGVSADVRAVDGDVVVVKMESDIDDVLNVDNDVGLASQALREYREQSEQNVDSARTLSDAEEEDEDFNVEEALLKLYCRHNVSRV